MEPELIDEDFLVANHALTENAKRSLLNNSWFDLFSGLIVTIFSVSSLGLFSFAVYKEGMKKFFNGADEFIILIIVFIVLGLIFLLFFGFFKIKTFLTIRRTLKKITSQSLENIFNEQKVCSLFLALASGTIILMIIHNVSLTIFLQNFLGFQF